MYKLTENGYATLRNIDLTEMADAIMFDDNALTISVEDIELLLVIIHEEIATKGLSADQDSVTSHGRRLYSLYDELLAQK